MLADSLKMINQAEEQAEQILVTAHTQAQTIEKETYATIEKINATADAEIAAAIAKLPQPAPAKAADVNFRVTDKQLTAAVNLITKKLLELA